MKEVGDLDQRLEILRGLPDIQPPMFHPAPEEPINRLYQRIAMNNERHTRLYALRTILAGQIQTIDRQMLEAEHDNNLAHQELEQYEQR